VRIAGPRAFLTIKGKTEGATRAEFEYEIPVADAHALLALCEPGLIDKTRYTVDHDGHTWEIDAFHGHHQGLLLAEIELDAEDEPFTRPPWLGQEVTHNPRYYNATLSRPEEGD
jgi:CYTH domain-containing protein